MPTPRHRTLGVESFEDRLLPSSPGFYHDFSPGAFGPAHPGGPAHVEPAGPVRGGPDGFDPGRGHGPSPDDERGFVPAPDHGGLAVAVLVRRFDLVPAAVVEHVEEVGPPAVSHPPENPERAAFVERVEEFARSAVATPAGLAVFLPVRFAPAGDSRPSAEVVTQPGAPAAEAARHADAATSPTTPTLPGSSGAPPYYASTGPVLLEAPASETTDPRQTGATPAGPETGVPPVVVDIADPIDVDVPRGFPLAGLFGLDTAALEGQARQFLARVSDLADGLPEDLGGPEGSMWLVSAAVLTGGAGYALWANRSRGRTARFVAGPDSVLARWGEEHDARVR